MRFFGSRTAASLAVLAAVTMTVTPAMARGPGGWGPPRHHHYRGGISAGDLLAGAVVIGGIAAIASAASKNNRNVDSDGSDYRYPDGPDSDQGGYADDGYGNRDSSAPYGQGRYDDAPVNGDANRGQGQFGMAVDACSAELERTNHQVAAVDGVRRMSERYTVEGHLEDGNAYACSVDDTGRIRSVAVNGKAVF